MKIRLIDPKPNSFKVKSLIKEFFTQQILNEKDLKQTQPNPNPQNPMKPNKVIKPKFPMDYILFKFPNIKTVLTELLTVTFKDYLDNIYVVAPKPTTFKVVLKNEQFFTIIYNERSYIVKVEGKKYYLINLPERERAIEAIAELLNTKKFITSKSEDEEKDDDSSSGPDSEKSSKKSKKSSSGSSGPLSDMGTEGGKNDKGEDLPDLDGLLKGEEGSEPGEEPGGDEDKEPEELKEIKIRLV